MHQDEWRLKNYIFFESSLLMRGQSAEQIDYEPDIQNLKQVWREMEEDPEQKTLSRHPAAVTSKKGSKANTKKIVLSKPNIKPVRNPIDVDVIEVVTQPDKFTADPIFKEQNNFPQMPLITAAQDKSTVSQVDQLRRAIEQKDRELSLLRVNNVHFSDRIRQLEGQLQKKDELLQQMRTRERELINQASSLSSKEFNFNYGKVEYENFKGDCRRLLKMLKSTTEYNHFADFALGDDGVRFLHAANQTAKTKLDLPKSQAEAHFCTCNKAFIPEAGLWVPEKVYEFGKNFIKERKGDLTQAELQLLLYELNKIWREREKRIVNTVNALKANEVGKYKRKIQKITREEGTGGQA